MRNATAITVAARNRRAGRKKIEATPRPLVHLIPRSRKQSRPTTRLPAPNALPGSLGGPWGPVAAEPKMHFSRARSAETAD